MEAHVCGITEISDKQLESTCDEFAADTQLMEKLIAVSDTHTSTFASSCNMQCLRILFYHV